MREVITYFYFIITIRVNYKLGLISFITLCIYTG